MARDEQPSVRQPVPSQRRPPGEQQRVRDPPGGCAAGATTTRWLVGQDAVLARADRRVAHLVRNRQLAKSIADAGGAQVPSILSCKAAWAGTSVVVVEAAATSQDCSGCGARVQQSVSRRTPVCPSCGLVLDRDENAASTLLRAGQARHGAVAVATVVKQASPGFSR